MHALRNGHGGQALEQRLALAKIGLGLESGFGQRALVDRGAAQLMQLRFLLGGDRGAVFESGGQRRRFASGGQRRRFANAVEFFHQHLNALGGERAHYGDQVFRATILVAHHGIADAAFVGKILGGIGEQCGEGGFARQRFKDGFNCVGKERILRAVGDYLIRIVRQDGKNFCSVRRCEVRAASTDSNLALAGSASAAKRFDQIWTESFHR